jgi:hypothetical protein
MKRILTYILISLVIRIFIPSNLLCQTLSGIRTGTIPPSEKIVLFTDRAIYATGEKIRFSAGYFIDQDFQGKEWSTVLYVELTAQQGQSLLHEKFGLDPDGASGELLIPDDLPSGVYFLKSYTKWMRNFLPENYCWYPVKIINPYSNKVAAEIPPAQNQSITPPDTFEIRKGISCSTGKAVYSRREMAELSVKLEDKSGMSGNFSVTVVKANLASSSKYFTFNELNKQPGNISFYPDLRGISITGKVVENEKGIGVENALVQLSLLNKKSFYSGYYTGKNGEFIFSLPDGTGKHDFYLEALKEEIPLKIELDGEFCSKTYMPASMPFKLSETEKTIGQEICLNRQISSAFQVRQQAGAQAPGEINDERLSFYGDPVKTIYTKKYINLPNIKEFMFELIPEFTIEYFRKIPLIKPVVATSCGAWPALVMLDNLPVTDLSKFLALPVDKIEKIEFIDKGYVTGDIRHNGVIQAFSKNRDLAGIDLSKNSTFFNFNLFSPSDTTSSFWPSEELMKSRIPDRRNTLYWNPAINLVPGKELKFTFPTADLKGEYEVVVRGLSKDGNWIISGKTTFRVE